ncbi:MAG: iron dicitrate transport regulator FecR [Chthonomonadaceae bacterium]|nr:iron dicitrate transport regulator FecR [Chthonomonadaceae bacterium]
MSNTIKPEAEMIRDMLAVKRRVAAARRERTRLERAPARRLKALCLVAAVGLAALMGLMYDGDQNAQAEKYAEIAAVLKPTSLYHPATKKKAVAELHQAVLSADEVMTGKTGAAHIRFPDETIIKIGQNADFKVLYNTYVRTEGARKRAFSLSVGRIWTRVSTFLSDSSEFKIETPTAQAAVRGTRFSVHVSKNGATYISVYEGKVDVLVKRLGPPAISVLPGQELTVNPAAKQLPGVVAMRASEKKLWKSQQTDALGADADVLAEPKNKVRHALIDFEEQYVLRLTAHLAEKAHFNRLAGHAADDPDRAAYAHALHAARALQTAIVAADDSVTGYPSEIGLTDLQGLGADPSTVASVIDNIDGRRLLKYEKTPDGFRARIRAKAPSDAVIEIRQDTIKTLSGD